MAKEGAAGPGGGSLSTLEILLHLKRVALFTQLELDDLLRLREITREIRMNDGVTAIAEGDVGDSCYLLAQGAVEVFLKAKGDAPERRLALLEAPNYFGEMAIIENEPRSASVRTRGECLMLRIEGAEFRRMMESNAPLTFRMVQGFSRRLRAMNATK